MIKTERYNMTFKQIAEQLTLESLTGETFTIDQVEKIYYRALKKLENNNRLKSFYN